MPLRGRFAKRGENASPRVDKPVKESDDALGRSSIGAYLETQRVLRGISVEELAAQTRIPLRSLTRLEAGAFDADPDGFVRGFVRTVADALGLDKDDTLARLLTEPNAAEPGSSRLPASLVPFLVMAGAVLSLMALLGLANILLLPVAARAPEEPQIIYRRDPVRALAIAQEEGTPAGARATPSSIEAEAAERETARARLESVD